MIEKFKCYGISAYNSNCMKSNNPYSGIYEAKTSRTLDLAGGNPACNQGGIVVCEKKKEDTAWMVGNGQMHQVHLQPKTGALTTMHDQQIVLLPMSQED